MANTVQTQTAKTILSTDLASVTADRLIELCILYRSVPDADTTYPSRLKTELERRYDASAINSDETTYAVLQHFSNQFESPVSYFAYKMQEMSGQVNNDIWFSNNEQWLKAQIDNAENMSWLVGEPSILEKCLNNNRTLAFIAQSTVASTAVLTNADAVALWKNADNLWSIWMQYEQGLDVLAQSSALINYAINIPDVMSAILASSTAMSAILASSTAMSAIAASSTAMTAIAASSTAMTAIAASSTAMTAIAASSTAMSAIAASSTAMTAIAASSSARAALIANNDTLQSVRNTLYNTVKTHWQRHRVYKTAANSQVSGAANAVKSPAGLVFAVLGCHSSGYSAEAILKHPDDTEAARNNRYLGTNFSEMDGNIDGVSFNGATFDTSNVTYGRVYVELWTPKGE